MGSTSKRRSAFHCQPQISDTYNSVDIARKDIKQGAFNSEGIE